MSLTPGTKINPNLKVKLKAIKVLGKKCRENLQDLGLGRKFLDLMPKTQFIQGKVDKLNLNEIKIFLLCERLYSDDKGKL